MIKQVAERCRKCPEQWLINGSYNSHEQIEAATQRAEVYAPEAECVNAQARNRRLTQLLVRGKAKVRCVVLLHALVHNLMRIAALAPQSIGIETSTSSLAGLVAATG